MANDVTIGELAIGLKLRVEALEKATKIAEKRLKEIENENKNLVESNKEVDASWIAISATAVITFSKIVGAVKDATEEYKAHTQSMEALKNVASYTGNSMDAFSGIMDKYSGILEQTDLADTIKNFSLMNFTVEQTDQMIQALTNSAIRNRNANYTVSQAVKVASDGYKQGLSTLSDSAGVTENLSVMLDNYAKSLGKTASQLTETEKNQAYLNRTMLAAEPFAGAMEGYLDSLAGKQGEYSQAMRETKIAYAEALEPTLIAVTEAKTKLVTIIGNLINSNNTATNVVTTFGVTFLGLTTIIVGAKKAIDLYKTAIIAATGATKTFKIAVGTGITAAIISGVISLTNAYKDNKVELEELRIEQERYRDVLNDTVEFNPDNINSLENTKGKLDKYIKDLKEMEGYRDSIQDAIMLKENAIDMGLEDKYIEQADVIIEELQNKNTVITQEVKKQSDELKELFGINKQTLLSYNDLSGILDVYTKRLEEANAIENIANTLDIESTKNKQKETAEMKKTAQQMREYLNIIKTGDKTTSEYQNAVDELTKKYPEAASAGGPLIDVLEGIISAEELQAEGEWNKTQSFINNQISQINLALENKRVQEEVASYIGKSWSDIEPGLRTVLNLLQTMAGYSPADVPNVTPVKTYKSSGGGSYSNKRLDNYKKEIAHKKAMDQLSINEEINMYQYALRAYTRTTDEKRELREKIYSLNKELANKEKEMLDKQTEDYETYIQQQINNRGAEYNINERNKDYNKIIAMHKSYLNQIMQDERLSLDERQEIYREELSVIRDYEQQKRDLRVEQIDNTVSNLTDAITKQLEEMQEKDKKLLDENLKVIEEWKNARINAINEEYDARIETINKELEALDKAEQQKTRDEEDAEYEKKKKRLEELVTFEHDAVTKANYQKELDKLIDEYQKTLDKRVLEDKKEALNEQKDLLQQEQENQVQSIEKEAERQTEVYEKQLDELEKYYDEQINMAQKTAENMLLNVEQNQDKILNLLKNYGNEYEITGQTLGEKLAQGINEGIVNKIQNIIANIQNSLDAKIEAQIAKIASSAYNYEAGTNKPQVTTVEINQTNKFEQIPETPSETYRKLRNVSENLAAEIAGG